jgi:hypothetical protein
LLRFCPLLAGLLQEQYIDPGWLRRNRKFRFNTYTDRRQSQILLHPKEAMPFGLFSLLGLFVV